MGLGACGGRVHDLRVYQTSPVSHEAIEVWQGGNLIAIDDDVVVNNCTAGLTYQIRTTPLSCTTDVAAGKIATESSIVNPAANAVDNNNSTYSSTGNDTGAWLMVDLGQSYPINSVEVWNRFDQPSAAYFNVIVSDTNFNTPGKRKYKVLSIPESIALAVHSRFRQNPLQASLPPGDPFRVILLGNLNAGVSKKPRHVLKL